MAQHFRELIVWQRAIEMTVSTYELTRGFPKEEVYGLTSQMRRAAVSVASNIAEGHGRLHTNEYRQFLGVARASNYELQTQFVIARKLKFGEASLLVKAESESHEVGKMIHGILGSLKD